MAFALVAIPISFQAQDLPKRIRGYKVHSEIVRITSSARDSELSTPSVVSGSPEVSDVSINGLSFSIPVEFNSPEQSGKIDFLIFHDFELNGIPIRINEYRVPFEFRKGQTIELPMPITAFVPTFRLVQAGWREVKDPALEWAVTGRILVFGKFRKYGFYHRRVIPLDIEFSIPSPLIDPK